MKGNPMYRELKQNLIAKTIILIVLVLIPYGILIMLLSKLALISDRILLPYGLIGAFVLGFACYVFSYKTIKSHKN
jgi:hypothetical protein